MPKDRETSLCLCPEWRQHVDPMATQCENCGAYFSAMGDHHKLNTHPFLGQHSDGIYKTCMGIVTVLFTCALLALALQLLKEIAGK